MRDKTIQILIAPDKTAKTVEVLRIQIRQKKKTIKILMAPELTDKTLSLHYR